MTGPAEDVDVHALIDRVAHELKNATWALSGYTEMALGKIKKRAPERLGKDLDTLEEAGRRLAHLSREVRALARVAAAQEPEAVAVDLAALYTTCRARLLELHPDEGPRLPPSVPAAELAGDGRLLACVLSHLLENALVHASGPVALEVDAGAGALVVRDGGGGPCSLALEEWRVPFVSGCGRLGVGLSICDTLAGHAGWELTVGPDGDGTAARLVVGLRAPEAGAPVAAEPAATDACEPPPASGRVAIYMDDQAMNRQLVRRVLETRGWTLHLAEDGLAGLELASSTPADVVLIDLNMPGMNGSDVARELRRRGVTIPLVGFTASAPDEIDGEIDTSSFTCFLQKGVGSRDLPDKLDRLCRSPPPAAGSGDAPAGREDEAARWEELAAGIEALAATTPDAWGEEPARLQEEARALIRELGAAEVGA